MKIFQKNCSDVLDRLGIPAGDYDLVDQADKQKPHLVLYHLSEEPEKSVEKFLPGMLSYPDAYVLCFKGSRLAGLAGRLDLVKSVEQKFNRRVHFLYFAVPSGGAKGKLYDRLQDFARHVKDSVDRIDWAVLDPQWPEYLLALYVALRAMHAAGPGSTLEGALQTSAILRNIIVQAENEYRGLRNDSKASLDLASIDHAKAGPRAEEIWEQIQPILL